ncbi:unnamed protein product [Clonostachys rosea]|uniref:PNPLA domain-containing protein n=1 Tax=Bionectria ochroleuca TaxID=29856 RepID=A0ABY6UW44_BIOOC|nr:unnamed protein product [Clonostachys rosea]
MSRIQLKPRSGSKPLGVSECPLPFQRSHHMDQQDDINAFKAMYQRVLLNFKKDEPFLTVDAGGGTTDFALMRILSAQFEFPEISQVSAATGIGVGSFPDRQSLPSSR